MSGNGSNRRCIFTLFLPTHVFLPTILESFSEKYEEKISGLSYTANVNRKTVYTRTGFEFTHSGTPVSCYQVTGNGVLV